MNENEMNNNEMQVAAPVQEQVMVQQSADPVIPEVGKKSGMTTGQKLAGLGLIGFAIAGIVWLITVIVKGVKKVVNAFKKPQEAPVQQAAAPAPAVAQEQPAAVQQEVQQAAAPEQK